MNKHELGVVFDIVAVLALVGTSFVPAVLAQDNPEGKLGSKVWSGRSDDQPANEGEVSKVESIPEYIGLTGADIKTWVEIDLQTDGYQVDLAPNRELIKFLFEFKQVVQRYEVGPARLSENMYTRGWLFTEHLRTELSRAGYETVLSSLGGAEALGFLADYYKNPDIADQDGHEEPVSCVGAQIVAAAAGEVLTGGPVSTANFRGDALALAAKMLSLPDGVAAPSIENGVVVRLPRDKFEMERIEPRDTVAIRYGDAGGHEVVILAKSYNHLGETMVLVFDSNRMVGADGVETVGMPLLRWMTSEEFSRQNESEISQAVVIRPKN